MSYSRFYALPRSYSTSSGDPRGRAGATVPERTIFRYHPGFDNPVTSLSDPTRIDGKGFITDVQLIPKAGISNGYLLTVTDGHGQQDVYEFRTSGSVTPGNILVDISADTTAAQVAARFLTAVNGVSPVSHITGASQPTDQVRLTQDAGWLGGRTGFSGTFVAGANGVVSSQTLPAVFLITPIQNGYDPLLVVPGMQGPRPVWLGVNAKPVFLVT